MRPNSRTGLFSNSLNRFNKRNNKGSANSSISAQQATERDPLLTSSILNTQKNKASISKAGSLQNTEQTIGNRGTVRSRHNTQKNQVQVKQQSSQPDITDPSMGVKRSSSQSGRSHSHLQETSSEATYDSNESYNLYNNHGNSPLDSTSSVSRSPSWRQNRSFASQTSKCRHSVDYRQQYYNVRGNRLLRENSIPLDSPTFIEVPEEVYTVRKAALTVLEPLTYTWLIFAVGFSLTTILGFSRWLQLLPNIPYWFILLPAWLSHASLFGSHILSARALSTFIAEANENRQRQDTTDHLDRTEYLPLLQRSLKFGVKTGILSLCFFVFEVLLYLRLVRGSLSLTMTLTPIWILVIGGVIDGIICKTQHSIRLLCWVLIFLSLFFTVIKVDCERESLQWAVVLSPVVALLSIASLSLIYIVYGHQVGYFRLTESQLTSGILYSMAALICIVIVIVIGEVIPLEKAEIETRIFLVTLAPLVVALMGVGAWAVTRDEFERLLQFGGQPVVFPMKLRFEPNGWTSVESKGITTIPMFGEVSYEPLDSSTTESIELLACCSCYPYKEEEEEETIQYHR